MEQVPSAGLRIPFSSLNRRNRVQFAAIFMPRRASQILAPSLLSTIILGIVGSIVAGFIGHFLARPKPGAGFHPAGIILSIVGAIVILWIA